MTKKDFTLIADALVKAFHSCDEQEYHGVRIAMISVADRLESAFPRFDREEFIDYVWQRI